MAQTPEATIKRIAITGPECTGKTTLATQLASHFGTTWVREYARAFLSQINRPYTYDDITTIAKRQRALEEEAAVTANGFLFCDTCLLVCKVWSRWKYGKVDAWIEREIESTSYDLYLLPLPDIGWKADPLRENPNDRWDLLERYREELRTLNRTWVEISGSPEDRLKTAIGAVEELGR